MNVTTSTTEKDNIQQETEEVNIQSKTEENKTQSSILTTQIQNTIIIEPGITSNICIQTTRITADKATVPMKFHKKLTTTCADIVSIMPQKEEMTSEVQHIAVPEHVINAKYPMWQIVITNGLIPSLTFWITSLNELAQQLMHFGLKNLFENISSLNGCVPCIEACCYNLHYELSKIPEIISLLTSPLEQQDAVRNIVKMITNIINIFLEIEHNNVNNVNLYLERLIKIGQNPLVKNISRFDEVLPNIIESVEFLNKIQYHIVSPVIGCYVPDMDISKKLFELIRILYFIGFSALSR